MSTPESAHPPPFIQPPAKTHITTLIFLHGTSQTGPELASILLSFPIPTTVPASSSPSITKILPELLPNTKFIFPTGAPKPTTVFGGKITHTWFNIHTFADRTVGEEEQIPGLRESILYLSGLIEGEVEGLVENGVKREEARKRVVVGGFSSGAALAVFGMLSGAWGAVAGVVELSGWLPFKKQIEGVIEKNWRREEGASRGAVRGYLRDLVDLDDMREDKEEGAEVSERKKVLLCHGKKDIKVKYDWGVDMREVLKRMEERIECRGYEELEHWFCEEEMGDVVEFLKGVWDAV